MTQGDGSTSRNVRPAAPKSRQTLSRVFDADRVTAAGCGQIDVDVAMLSSSSPADAWRSFGADDRSTSPATLTLAVVPRRVMITSRPWKPSNTGNSERWLRGSHPVVRRL